MRFQSSSSSSTSTLAGAAAAAALTLALAGSTFAAPAIHPADAISRRDGSNNAWNPLYTVYPSVVSQYTVSTGAVDFNTHHGLVDKSTDNHGADITTLVTFTVPDAYASNTCELVFDLITPPSTYTGGPLVSGSGGAQVFCSLAPATASTDTWPQGNQRNNYIGTLSAVVGGRATWDLPATSRQMSCKELTGGRLFGGEVVPTGDNDHILWNSAFEGLKIVIY